MLKKCGIEQLYFTGIVTNGGVASTVRDAHVREFHCTVIADGCAAFSRETHDAAIEGLRPVAKRASRSSDAIVARYSSSAHKKEPRPEPGFSLHITRRT